MARMDLLRHGELEGGVRYRGRVDDPLTDAGRRSMDAVWEHLRHEVDTIIASPLARCAGPARAWAEAAGIECILDERIAELHYGDWEGLSADEIRQGWPGMLERWRADPSGMRPPNGESPEELRARIEDFLRQWMACDAGRKLLVVAHSGSLRMLLAAALGAPIAATRRFAMPYACWSRLSLAGGQPLLEFHQRSA